MIKVLHKMDLPTGMKIIFNVKHSDVIRLKFRAKFLTFITKLVLEGKASIYYTIKENLLLYCRKFSAFVAVFII